MKTVTAAPIADNSFLIEEAYNQEPDAFQFIQTYQFNRSDEVNSLGAYAITVEMPLHSQTHQLSLTLPFQTLEVSGTKFSGMADATLGYRYQLIIKSPIAVAPRISMIIPSGKKDDGLGTGSMGIQTAVALSLEFGKTFVNHWNFGFTFVPNAKTVSTNFATSLVYLFSDSLNFLTEFSHSSSEVAATNGSKSRSETYYVNPGLRYAHNFGETQLVPGISFPIGIAASEAEDYGILFYLSLEGRPW